MKKIIVGFILLILATSAFSQQTSSSPVLTKQDYLEKSKKQKTTAKILFVVGGAMFMTGILVITDDIGGIGNPNDKQNSSLADVLGYAGATVAVASIPFLVSAGRNKRKAMSISFKNELSPQIQKSSFVYRAIPSFTLKFQL